MAAGEAFTFISRQRIDAAIAALDAQTGLTCSVYVGATDHVGDDRADPGRPAASAVSIETFANLALAELPASAAGTVLLVVDPGRRQSVIRTDARAAYRITDESCALATLSMTTSFGAGDLVGGIVLGLRMLADAAAPAGADPGRPEPTSSTVTRR